MPYVVYEGPKQTAAMTTQRQNASNTARIVGFAVAAMVVIIVLVVVFRGCYQPQDPPPQVSTEDTRTDGPVVPPVER